MKVYLAGKITGDPGYRAKFRAAREKVEWMGHIALDPSVLPEGMETADYMRICTAMLDSADAIGLLRDWADSPGARCEMALAQYLDKEGMSNEDLGRIYAEVEALSDSVIRGYCSISDLRDTLRREAGILIE